MEVTIKTKFNIGQEVVYYDPYNNKLATMKIDLISCSISEEGCSALFLHDNEQNICKEEKNVFESREEFINNL